MTSSPRSAAESRVVRSPLARVLPWAAAGLLLAWFIIQLAYFWRTNTVLYTDAADAGRFGVFSGLLSTDWSFSLRHSPPLLVLGSVVLVGLTTFLGLLIHASLGIRQSRVAAIALAFVTGLGVSMIAFELLTIAGLLRGWSAWLLWLAMLAPLVVLARRRGISLISFDPPAPVHPTSVLGRAFWWAGFAIVALITLATFWHAAFFPESYWDSLILYLGYSRMMALEGAFPFKAVGQVGIGLGANYPHLFELYGAVAGRMFGGWHEIHQRLLAPLCGLVVTLLIYDLVRAITGRPWVAMATVVLLRATPLGIFYLTAASNYSTVLLFTAAFLVAIHLFAQRPAPGTFFLSALMPAAAMHVNYLMGLLWVAWLPAVLFVVYGDPRSRARCVLHWKTALLLFAAAIALASPWHVRNWVLTGNPVYAFFPQFFPGTIHVNPEVMRSADLEWFRNGDGVGMLAEQAHDLARNAERFRNPHAPGFERRATLGNRLDASWRFWQGFDTIRPTEDGAIRVGTWTDRADFLLQRSLLGVQPEPPYDLHQTLTRRNVQILDNRQAYKLAPITMAFGFPALLALPVWVLWRRRRDGALPAPEGAAVAIAAVILALGLLGYHYLLADYYLYQIIAILIPIALGAAFILSRFAWLRGRAGTILRGGLAAGVLVAGLVPGVAMSLMNFKTFEPRVVDGRWWSPFALDIFRHPGMDDAVFQRIRWGDDAEMFDRVNDLLGDEPLLTHDNRHLAYHPGIELVHLDDWDVQQIWDAPASERLAFFRARGIRYYLRIPNEAHHEINARAGIDELIAAGHLQPIATYGGNTLYRFDGD